MFNSHPPLSTFKDIVSLVRKQQEWIMNIPGPDANDEVKLRYSSRLFAATAQLQRARGELNSSNPAALEIWDRATQHPSMLAADLTLVKLSEINLKRQLNGLVKVVSSMVCDPPLGSKRAAHDRLVCDLLEVLQDIHITDFSGQTRSLKSLVPVIKQVMFSDAANFMTCTEVAHMECSGDEVAILFANQLDDSIQRYNAVAKDLQELSKDSARFLMPLMHTVIGLIASSDIMLVELPHDTVQTTAVIKRGAELCFLSDAVPGNSVKAAKKQKK